VTTAGSLGGSALAWIPANGHCAGPPRMVQSALERYALPDRLLPQGHANIQTCDRAVEKLGLWSCRRGLELAEVTVMFRASLSLVRPVTGRASARSERARCTRRPAQPEAEAD
jgi:hypothetical protein